MKVIYGTSALEATNIEASTLTVGTFDGVHRGHMVLLNRLIEAAAEYDTPSAVVTFDPHPQMVLGLRGRTEILNTTEEKLELLEKMNLDLVAILEFNQQLASLEAEEFIKRILHEDLKMKHFVVGYDHCFGKSRRGDFELVKANARHYNYTYEMVEPEHNGDGPIKSSRIRRELKTGDFALATKMLGYPYFVTGEIVRGRGVGKELGFPTINFNIPPGKLLPKSGVYAARVIADGQTIPGMAYIGGRLTFGDETITVEVNLFDFDGDLAGKKVRMVLERFTRAPIKFNTPEELKTALAEDEKKVKKILDL
ncbi:MAG: bifunctional riboflavin kinase/FAD synthetase [candidate division Zixibacteria bacterium]|nr:bifunctional riboflavin kinase/FAD synthetase [candidate division Zixibacteria bacterium]